MIDAEAEAGQYGDELTRLSVAVGSVWRGTRDNDRGVFQVAGETTVDGVDAVTLYPNDHMTVDEFHELMIKQIIEPVSCPGTRIYR